MRLSKSSCSLVYVHGTNGSGKSTLARAVIAAAGGVDGNTLVAKHKKAILTHTARGLDLIGAYGTACGGVDGLNPYASIHDLVARTKGNVFAEGLITPGVETCATLARNFEKHLFIYLDTPIEQCLTNVMKRRKRKGNTKPFSPDNLYRKHASAQSWVNRLEQAGLHVARLPYREAYLACLEVLGLPEPDLEELL